MIKKSIIYTNENCIGCNKCIKACSAIGACISKEENGRSRIVVDGKKCVACGSCIDVCEHNAREYTDDTDRFFKDLKAGKKISLLLAPAFKANYPDTCERILGYLKSLGAGRIISVSFGADITTWGYLNYIKEYNFFGGISQPCPALVAYIERYIPELIPKLFPVQSPLMCAAIYARKKLGITDSFAFISPCIAKKMEIDDPHNEGLVQYNVSFEHLLKHVEPHISSAKEVTSEIEYGLGSFYPTPGGLAENIKWFLGEDVFIRQVEGEKHLYEWLHANTDRIKNTETPFLFIDALNCEKGCICGTAVNTKSKTDEALYELLRIRERSKKNSGESPWSRCLTPEERLEKYNKQFEDLNLNDYLREYTDRSGMCGYDIPNPVQLDEIFHEMNKDTAESRHIDCTSCGYESCLQMAYAIFNGFNHKENCIHYEKDMVKELEIEKAIAEQAAKAKGSFLANMSHEIRTPINAILGMDEMILRETEEKYTREYAVNIKRSGDLLLSLINNILDFSKIEAGKMELNYAKYDMANLIKDVDNMMRTRMELKSLEFMIELDPAIPRYLYGDNLRIEQCLINILTNALKYTETGSVKLRAKLLERDDKNATIRYTCTDTGIGIKEEDQDSLFKAFERIDESRNRNIEGTGLGMSIVTNLLGLMDTHLEVESEYGKGSTFSFNISQTIVQDVPVGDYHSLFKEENVTFGKTLKTFIAPYARILVVDDAHMNLVVVKSFLKRTQVTVDTAESAGEALELLGTNEYDVLFYDHMMPETDGVELLRMTRALKNNPNSKKPCIVLTANAVEGVKDYYLNEGFDDYMSKPINGNKFEALLMNYLPDDLIKPVEEEEIESPQDGLDAAIVPERYSSLSGIDPAEGIKNCGSVKDYESLLEIFYRSLESKSEELEKLYNAGDRTNYTIRVHAFKSSARLIGASQFADDAQALENAGKNGDTEFIRSHHAPLMEKSRQLSSILKPLFEKKLSGDKINADKSVAHDFTQRLAEAAENMDIDALEEIISEMEQYEFEPSFKEKFDEALRYCDNFDYDGIINALS